METARFGCETAVSRTVKANGLELHLLEWGERGRPGLCFLHGGSAHAHWFDRVVPAFVERFHVVALDQRGHGESEWPRPPAYRTEDFTTDLDSLMDALGWRDMVLVGHSMGGHNAMAFAARHPVRLRALVIVDSRPTIQPDRLRMLHARGHRPLRRHPSIDTAIASFRLLPRETLAEPTLLEHLARAGLIQRDGGWVYRFDPEASASRRPIDAWTVLGQIVAPTLIVRGERSAILSRATAERLRAAIPGARLVEIPEAYHHVVLDRPHEFVTALETFFDSQ